MLKSALLPASLMSLCIATTVLAATPGINLSWSGCDTSPASLDRSYACDGQLASLFTITGSFRLDQGVPDFAGCNSRIVVAWDVAIPDYWKIASGECDYGAFSTLLPPTTAPCASGTLFDPCCSFTGFSTSPLTSNRMEFLIDAANSSTTHPSVVAGDLYAAFRLALDPDQGALNGCAGCSAPACLVLDNVVVLGYASGEEYPITTTDQRAYVTWQGGAVYYGCPAATPTRASTWGSVKALYR